jgi:F-type H+-transporting ATPase subunit delta
MSAAAEARQSELDRVTDAQRLSAKLAGELFGVADLLADQASLRNALADPTSQDEHRKAMAQAVLADKISAGALKVVSEAAGLRWASGSRLTDAINRQGLRALFGTAQGGDKLDRIEEELFRLGRTVAADPALRSALNNRNASVASRQQLLADLVGKKVDSSTLTLAQRALAFTSRSFEPTIEEYLRLAAAIRERAVVTVTVAQALTAEQAERLKTILIGKLNHEVSLQIVVDPSVLGGARVRVGDEVIEGTVAGRLSAAEQQLTQ